MDVANLCAFKRGFKLIGAKCANIYSVHYVCASGGFCNSSSGGDVDRPLAWSVLESEASGSIISLCAPRPNLTFVFYTR